MRCIRTGTRVIEARCSTRDQTEKYASARARLCAHDRSEGMVRPLLSPPLPPSCSPSIVRKNGVYESCMGARNGAATNFHCTVAAVHAPSDVINQLFRPQQIIATEISAQFTGGGRSRGGGGRGIDRVHEHKTQHTNTHTNGNPRIRNAELHAQDANAHSPLCAEMRFPNAQQPHGRVSSTRAIRCVS